ncbi:MAG TPA: alpha/beta hydrolase, partial [Gemmatimonadaceae bacterium]
MTYFIVAHSRFTAMRTSLLAPVALLAFTPALRAASVRRAPNPCTKAVAACEQWVTHGSGPARSMVYASYPLETPNASITRALIMVHGAGRNADHYFETATGAAFLAGALENTIVIAPRFSAGKDKVAANEVLWPERGQNWRSGGAPESLPAVGSFDFVDEIVKKLADKKIFPNLTKVVIAGHSAGGQFATRYEMSNKIHGSVGVAMSYVVANPSSYAWPASVRPLPTGDADPATADKEALGANGEKVNTNFTYGAFDAAKAPMFDRWPAGLEDRHGYTEKMSDEQMRKQLAERPTTYLLGQVDVLPLGGFDGSPTAMAQGPTRRARGEAFVKYITDNLGAKPTAIVVPECGHNDRCIFTTDIV